MVVRLPVRDSNDDHNCSEQNKAEVKREPRQPRRDQIFMIFLAGTRVAQDLAKLISTYRQTSTSSACHNIPLFLLIMRTPDIYSCMDLPYLCTGRLLTFPFVCSLNLSEVIVKILPSPAHVVESSNRDKKTDLSNHLQTSILSLVPTCGDNQSCPPRTLTTGFPTSSLPNMQA